MDLTCVCPWLDLPPWWRYLSLCSWKRKRWEYLRSLDFKRTPYHVLSTIRTLKRALSGEQWGEPGGDRIHPLSTGAGQATVCYVFVFFLKSSAVSLSDLCLCFNSFAFTKLSRRISLYWLLKMLSEEKIRNITLVRSNTLSLITVF